GRSKGLRASFASRPEGRGNLADSRTNRWRSCGRQLESRWAALLQRFDNDLRADVTRPGRGRRAGRASGWDEANRSYSRRRVRERPKANGRTVQHGPGGSGLIGPETFRRTPVRAVRTHVGRSERPLPVVFNDWSMP